MEYIHFQLSLNYTRTALVHENFKASQWNFYGVSKAIRKKNYFSKLSFFIYIFIYFYYKLYYYTPSLHIAERNIIYYFCSFLVILA